ncbi:MAG: formylglycine-generating enzyme family protein [Trichodesmium erythraeum GBRTRLIN201]|nr:formylglycine-generating enzyme family protein [Trichodesmium erythraeum GBRTRLIN201]
MIYIPGGSFIMGLPQNEAFEGDRKALQHEVTLPPFYMSKYPITQDQYQAITGSNPSHFRGRNRPVEFQISTSFPFNKIIRDNATKFCQKLSVKTGKKYSLPSESQWEYACRAGTTTPFYFGETIISELVNFDGYGCPYGNAPKEKYRRETTDVGIFPANAFGLYDMHGNIWDSQFNYQKSYLAHVHYLIR